MADAQSEAQCADSAAASLSGHAIIAGFGIPGRAAAEQLCRQGVAVCVIELNAKTVERISKTSIHGLHVIVGNVSDEATLRRAGIERATLFAITVPVDAAVLEAVRIARRLSPGIHIVAAAGTSPPRCKPPGAERMKSSPRSRWSPKSSAG